MAVQENTDQDKDYQVRAWLNSRHDTCHPKAYNAINKTNGKNLMQSIKMSEGGRVVIPADIRHALGVKEGDSLLIELIDGEARITTRAARLNRAQTLFQQYVPTDSPSIVDELIADRRAAAERGD